MDGFGSPHRIKAAIRQKLAGCAPPRAGAAPSPFQRRQSPPRITEASMYPHVTQFESRRRDLERRLGGRPKHPRAREASAGRETSGPGRYKLALLTWAAAYSVITLMLAVLGPAMASWPLALRTLLLSMTMVVALTWLIMPRLTRLFRPWLSAGAR
jgi:hypothetical protein